MALALLTTRVLLPFVLLLTAIEAQMNGDCSMIAYENDNFKGRGMGAGFGHFAGVSIDDRISSIVFSGVPTCRLIVYEHRNFGGWARTLTPGNYKKKDLEARGVRNDAISSFKIENQFDFCEEFGCSCQGMSDLWGTGVSTGWADVEHVTLLKGFVHGVRAGKNELLWWWQHHKCNTNPYNRCSSHHCNGHWKLRNAGARCHGNCPVNTNTCCKVENCDKVKVVGISYKENDWTVGAPKIKNLDHYTLEGNNCGSSQERSLDSFIKTRHVSVTHEESLTLGRSLEQAFGWAFTQEKTIEFSESASMSMELPLSKAGGSVGASSSSTRTWSETSSFAVERGFTMGSDQIKTTARSKETSETIEFGGIKQIVPAFAWHRHKVQYLEREVALNLELTVQCIVNGVNARQIKIPDSKIVSAIESYTYYAPMEDRTDMCKNTHSAYGTCECFPDLRSTMHKETGCQARWSEDGTRKTDRKGCYVYKGAGCADALGLTDGHPDHYHGNTELTRAFTQDYPLDGSMFRWSYDACDPNYQLPCAPGYTSNPGDVANWGSIDGVGGGQAVETCLACARLCDLTDKCKSYECSKTELKCSLNVAAMPTSLEVVADYDFCTKDARNTWQKGWCQFRGNDQNSGLIQVNKNDGDSSHAQDVCMAACEKHQGATGCEVIWHQGNRGCYIHTKPITEANGKDRHLCSIFKYKGAGRRRMSNDERGVEAESNSLLAPLTF